MKRILDVRFLSAALICLLGASMAYGQGGAPQQQGGAPTPDVSDEQIESVAAAYASIQDLREQYQKEHGNLQALDSTKAAQVQRQFRKETQSIISDEGLKPQTFSLVMQTVNRDPELRNKLFSAIEEAGGQPPQMPSRQQQRPQPNISDAQLQSVAQAFVAIQDLRSQFQEEHGNLQALDSTKAAQVQQQFRQQTQQVLKEEGVNPQTFAQVMQAVRTNAQLRNKFFSAIKAAGGTVPGGAQQQR